MQFKGSSEEFLQLWRRPISNLTSNKDNRRKLPLKDRGNFFLWKAFLGAVCWYSADLSPEVQTSLCYWLCQYTSCSSHCPYLRMGKVKESKGKTKQNPIQMRSLSLEVFEMHPEKSPCLYVKFSNFTVLLFSIKNEATLWTKSEQNISINLVDTRKSRSLCLQLCIVFAKQAPISKLYLKSWCLTKANTESCIWNSLDANWLESSFTERTWDSWKENWTWVSSLPLQW